MDPRPIILTLMAVIVVTLAASMFFLVRDDSSRTRTLTLLKLRVVLSLLLIGIFIVSVAMGWLQPNSAVPR